MTDADQLMSFCFAETSCFLVPAEALSDQGVCAQFATKIPSERLSAKQLTHLNEGYSLYCHRLQQLFARAPASWFPPRRANMLIVGDASRVPPYYMPFWGTTTLLYLSDLNCNAEVVAYLLIHADRLLQTGSPSTAAILDLSYWLTLEDHERTAFALGAKDLTRPDGEAYRKIAEALNWVTLLHHASLKPITISSAAEPYGQIHELLIPHRLATKIETHSTNMAAAAQKALQRSTKLRPSSTSAVSELIRWLQNERPHLTVLDPKGNECYSPAETKVAALERALIGLSDEAAESLREDFTIISCRTRNFLSAVHGTLPERCTVLEAGDGAWVDPKRRSIVYSLSQPSFDPLTRAAPPYQRLLLGARVAHEWGHLAHEGKLIRVPDEEKTKYHDRRLALGQTFAELIEQLPLSMQTHVDHELTALRINRAELAKCLAKLTLSRVGDYTANLVARAFLPEPEVQAYVRTNVCSHMNKGIGLIAQISRHAHEVQYLPFAGLDLDWFFATSCFADYIIKPGFVSETALLSLFAAMADVFACYKIDPERLVLPD
jgi:hypothetical protein